MAAPTLTAAAVGEFATMHILMAAIALIETQPSIATVLGEASFVTARARDLFVLAAQWKDGACMRSQRNRPRHAEPSNRRMTLHAVGTKTCLVHRAMTVNACPTLTRRCGRSAIVTGVARNIGVARSQAQARMIGASHRDFIPAILAVATRACVAEVSLMWIRVAARACLELDAAITRRGSVTLCASNSCMRAMQREACMAVVEVRKIGLMPVLLVVAGLAFTPEAVFVWILVTRSACALQSQECRRPSLIAAVVTLSTCLLRVRAMQRPTRFGVVEALHRAARPTR